VSTLVTVIAKCGTPSSPSLPSMLLAAGTTQIWVRIDAVRLCQQCTLVIRCEPKPEFNVSGAVWLRVPAP
jgi:hypothetical protein